MPTRSFSGKWHRRGNGHYVRKRYVAKSEKYVYDHVFRNFGSDQWRVWIETMSRKEIARGKRTWDTRLEATSALERQIQKANLK